MSSSLYSYLETVRLYDYSGVMMISAVGYDYFLTLSREIDYVWCRTWTWVSTLFVVIRYIGICWIITSALNHSTLVPGPINVSIAVSLVHYWAYALFIAGADLVMIWRVYAMWNQSKTILRILLFIYILQIGITFAWDGIFEYPGRTLTVKLQRIPGFGAFCTYADMMFPYWVIYRAIPRFVLGAVLLTLAVIPPLKQALDMYKVTKQWRGQQSTVRLLVREGAVYFIVNLLFNVLGVIQPKSPLTIRSMYFFNSVCYSVACAIMPRFIIGVRELYDRPRRDQWHGLDTGFGAVSRPFPGESTYPSAIAFADRVFRSQNDHELVEGDVEESEVVQLDVFHNGEYDGCR